MVKSDLHVSAGLSITELGAIDTCYLSVYAIGQFVSGWIGDRIGARRVIAIGLIGSAMASCALGYAKYAAFFGIFFGINGLFQSTGWSNNIKAMEPWFTQNSRGKVLGLWGTNQQVGGLIATVLAAFLLSRYGWSSAFIVPSVLVGLVGVMVYFLLLEPDKSALETAIDGDVSIGSLSDFRQIMRDPFLWSLSFSYFGLKLIRYSLLFWLPFYLHHELHIKAGMAGYLSVSFEVGGIIGSIATGWISDRFFAKARVRLIIPMILLLACMLYLYKEYAAYGIVFNCFLMGLIGLFVFGPDALMSGACAQDIGGDRLTGSVAGFINGVGSVGAILQGLVTAYVSRLFGWSALFYVFVFIAFLSALVLLPFLWISSGKYADSEAVREIA